MRDAVIKVITEAARKDRDIMFLSADMGAPALDEFRRDLPDQFIQVGIAEQNMIDVAAGLALSGKKVFCYAMAPFMPARCFEQIKCSLASMNLPVCLIGVGVGLGYDHTAMTHIQVEDIALMRTINHVEIVTPADDNMAAAAIKNILDSPRFVYLRLERPSKNDAILNTGKICELFANIGVFSPQAHRDAKVSIIGCGGILHEAIAAANELWTLDVPAQVIDLMRLKPFPVEHLIPLLGLNHLQAIITVEEHVLNGGLGTAVMENLAGKVKLIPHRMGIPDGYEVCNGDRAELRRHFGLDAESIKKAALEMINGK